MYCRGVQWRDEIPPCGSLWVVLPARLVASLLSCKPGAVVRLHDAKVARLDVSPRVWRATKLRCDGRSGIPLMVPREWQLAESGANLFVFLVVWGKC